MGFRWEFQPTLVTLNNLNINGTNNKKKLKTKKMENTNTNNESLKGVRILRSYYEALDEFNYEEKGRMFEAIMEYGLNGAEPNFDGADDARALRGIWKTYLPIIDNSINRAIASAKNGNKGGAPVKKSNDVVEPSKTSTQNKAPESTIITQPIPEVKKEEIVSEIEDIFSINEDGYITLVDLFKDFKNQQYIIDSKIKEDIAEFHSDKYGYPSLFDKEDIAKFIKIRYKDYDNKINEYIINKIKNQKQLA